MNKKVKIGLTILIAFLSIFMSGGLYVYSIFHRIQDTTEGHGSGSTITEKDNETTLEDLNLKEIDGITNILLVGVDEREDGEATGADAIMIITIDNIHNKIKVSSIMRDALVTIPKYGDSKITQAHRVGGVDMLISTVEYNFNINIDKYVKMNFKGFKHIIDTVDGVEVTLNSKEEVNELNRCLLLEKYEDPSYKDDKFKGIIDKGWLLRDKEEYRNVPDLKDNDKITKKEYNYIAEKGEFVEDIGTITLNGTQALAYSRMRHVGNGVYDRVERQGQIMEVMIEKISKMSPMKYIPLAEKLVSYVKTNIGMSEGLNLAYTGLKIVTNSPEFTISKMQVPPEGLRDGFIVDSSFLAENMDLWVEIMDKENTVKAMHGFIFDDITYDPSKYPTYDAEVNGYFGPNNGNLKNNTNEFEENKNSNESIDSTESNNSSKGNNESNTENNGSTNNSSDSDINNSGSSESNKDNSEPQNNNSENNGSTNNSSDINNSGSSEGSKDNSQLQNNNSENTSSQNNSLNNNGSTENSSNNGSGSTTP